MSHHLLLPYTHSTIFRCSLLTGWLHRSSCFYLFRFVYIDLYRFSNSDGCCIFLLKMSSFMDLLYLSNLHSPIPQMRFLSYLVINLNIQHSWSSLELYDGVVSSCILVCSLISSSFLFVVYLHLLSLTWRSCGSFLLSIPPPWSWIVLCSNLFLHSHFLFNALDVSFHITINPWQPTKPIYRIQILHALGKLSQPPTKV